MTTTKSFTELANSIGQLVESKNKAYGSAFDKSGDFIRVLYPEGIKPEQYKDMLCIVRVFDKLMRIATSYEGTEEKKVDAYSDLMGYGLLGLRASLEEKEAQTQAKEKQELAEAGFTPEQVGRWKEVLDKAEKPDNNTIAYSVEEKLIREAAKKEKDPKTGADIIKSIAEYYVYSDRGTTTQTYGSSVNSGLRIAPESIINVNSGLMDAKNTFVISYLHKAIKPLNQLRMIEDAVVIYRVSRAPERRVFYIDVGNLPKGKAEQYLRDIMSKYRNKMVYDASTGELRDDRKHMSMLEDFWLPRREGGKGTEISTLPGGENLGQIEDIIYFQKKLYRSLNVPMSRMETETGFSLGRSNEISRDELKFSKFVQRLRRKFSDLFLQVLRTQLILKGVISREDWEVMKEDIKVDFRKDNYFAELKESEILRERMQTLQLIDPFVGKYYSAMWVRKNILRQGDDEIEEINAEMEMEAPPPMPEGADGQAQEGQPPEPTADNPGVPPIDGEVQQ